MTAVQALKAARDAGVRIGIDGDALTLNADSAPPPSLLDLLARHKAGVVALLQPAAGGWSALDWLAFFDERERSAAAHGVVRGEASARAFACCVVAWLDRHPAPSAPGRCASCRKTESCDAVVLPFGIRPGTHTWLHPGCWSAWHIARRRQAIAALAAMGIDEPRIRQ